MPLISLSSSYPYWETNCEQWKRETSSYHLSEDCSRPAKVWTSLKRQLSRHVNWGKWSFWATKQTFLTDIIQYFTDIDRYASLNRYHISADISVAVLQPIPIYRFCQYGLYRPIFYIGRYRYANPGEDSKISMHLITKYEVNFAEFLNSPLPLPACVCILYSLG